MRPQYKFATKGSIVKKGIKTVHGDPKLKEKCKEVDDSLKVWVGGLAAKTSAGSLKKHFADADCKPHLTSIMGKGRACLSFKTTDEVEEAVSALTGSTLDGKTLEVDVWTKPERKVKSD